MTTAVLDPIVARYVPQFDPRADESPATQARRRAAWERFQAQGLPDAHDEAWRQTPLRALRARAGAAAADVPAALLAKATADLAAQGLDPAAPLGVWANGVPVRHSGEFLPAPPEEWALAPLELPFVALNVALAPRVVGLTVPAEPGPPIQLVYLHASGTAGSEHHTRVQIHVPAGARRTLLEVHCALDDTAPVLATNLTEIRLEAGAALEHAAWIAGGAGAHHVATAQVAVGRDAAYRRHDFTDGGALIRREIRVRFEAPGGHAELGGLQLGRGTGVTDIHTFVEHATTDATSAQLYQAVLADRSRGVFEGHVRIAPGALRSSARQSCRALLLGDGALMHAKPLLEILADDVQCAHGTAIGQLDTDALFYLRSRGIAVRAARRMLAEAFADTVVERVTDPVARAFLAPRVRAALPLEDPR